MANLSPVTDTTARPLSGAGAAENRVPSLGRCAPIRSSRTSSGSARCRTSSVPSGCSTSSAVGGSWRRLTRGLPLPVGSWVCQPSTLVISAASSGSTATGGRVVLRDSPQVMSKSAEISKNSNEIDPRPCARHGAGPSRVNRRSMPNKPTPNALSDTPAEMLMMNENGENRNSASNDRCPSMPKSSKPSRSSAFAPNCTVLLVTAKYPDTRISSPGWLRMSTCNR